jgi:hypothetical protein
MKGASRVNTRCKLGLLLLLLLVAACTGPTPESAPTLLPATLLLSDDFSPPNAAWARFETEETAVYIQAGELYLEDRGKGVAVVAPLTRPAYTDVVVSVKVRHVQGTVDNWMGVVCRQQDEDNYYLLAISADGYYLILRVEDGTPTPLAGPKPSDIIRVGKTTNDVEARCRGGSLSLRVNDTFLVARTDTALSDSGQVALFADAVESGATAITAFDDFTLSTP